MTNLGILIKNYINCLLSRFRGKKKRLSNFVAVAIILVLGLAIIALYSFQAYEMFNAFAPVKMLELPLFHGILIALTVIVLIAVMRVSGATKTGDTELLLSLPVRKFDIVVAKTVSKYLFDFMFVFVLFVPYLVFYQTFTQFSIGITLRGVLVTLLLPLLSVGISYVYDFIITRIFNRIRVGNILKSLISVFVFVLIMALMFIKTFTYGIVEAGSLEAYFADRFFTNMFLQFILGNPVLYSVIGTVLCIGVFALGLFLFSINIGKTLSKYSGKPGNLKFSENMGGFKRLFKKEITFYASTPAYIVNTIIGSIIILVLGVVLSIMGLDGISGLLGGLALDADTIALVLTLAFCGSASTVFISSCSISLEGKNFWIIKTSPVSEVGVFMSKICLNVLMVVPAIVFSSVLLTITLGISFKYFLFMLILPTILNLALSVGGLLFNLWLPKFDWEDPTVVVKQGLPTLLTMFLGIFLTMLPVAVMLIFNIESMKLLMIITLTVFALVFALFTILLFTIGKKLYRKL